MDTRLKNSSRTLYSVFFVICVCAFLTCIISIVAAASLNGFSWYAQPDDLIDNGGYSSFDEFLRHNAGAVPAIWHVFERHMKVWLIVAVASGVIALLALIYLVLSVGERERERDGQGNIVITRFDYIFSEVQLVGVCLIFFVGGAFFVQLVQGVLESVYELGRYYSTFDIVLNAAMAIIIGLVSASLGLGIGLSCVKKVKAGVFLDRSIFGLIFFTAYGEVYKSGSPMRRIMLILVLICLLSATIFLAPVVLIMILIFAPKWVHRYEEIRKGLDEVNNGNLKYKIPVQGEDELDQLAIGINKITEATSTAVQNELKNQRMKTDLISNVSHDLKTPLTSMVTYIDLLKTEGLDSKNAPEYLDILQQKTERLRQLTEDLFEAAKASSGATPVHMSRVDLLSLLNQGLGELGDLVETSHLEFVVNAQQERYFVRADGQLLWRVISNLLGNVLKYSQEYTRVYINITRQAAESGNLVFMEVKNISRQSLNMDPSELMERFKRGDESRTTEGSGLGLAIAKDLMKLMDGWLELSIDGDLFKAKIMLNAAAEDESAAADMGDMDMDLTGLNMETGMGTDMNEKMAAAEANAEGSPFDTKDKKQPFNEERFCQEAKQFRETLQSDIALFPSDFDLDFTAKTAEQAAERDAQPGDSQAHRSGAHAVSQGNLERLKRGSSKIE